ncbi:kinesin-like protein KIN-14K [Bidens hawaiensis]|uniref:kinesin-like protein KIN-14K n=1 Tax=Bidens hawaiensis TaxID=980011 RepID=UPI00404B6B63
MDRDTKEYARLNISHSSPSSDVFEPTSANDAKTRTSVIEWLNSTLPNLNLPVNASDEELRTRLVDGTVLCRLMNRLRPVSDIEYGNPHHSSEAHRENVNKFLKSMDEMGLPHFNISELEKVIISVEIDGTCMFHL